jgi:hypothetical protein
MGSKERQLSYSIAFKVEVVNYAEKHGSEASSENNCEDDFSGSDDNFWVAIMNTVYYGC